jgi:Ni/Co efflux regulator RcnB
MKTLVHTVCAVAVIAVPIASLAQSDGALTRAQVQAEIAQLQQAGFNPANANTVDFPANMPATNASTADQNSGYGPATNGSSQMGRPASTSGMKPVFFGGS